MTNLICVSVSCDDKDWEKNLPIQFWLEKPFFNAVCFHKEALSGASVVSKLSIHSEYLWTVIDFDPIETDINKLFKGTSVTNELTNPEYVEDFIKNGTLHIGITDYFYRVLLQENKDKRYEAIESYFQLMCYGVASTIKQAFDIEDEFEIKEFEKIKLTYLQQQKGKK